MLYNVILVSGIQQSEAVIYIHVHTPFRFFSHIGHYRALSRAPCAIYCRSLLYILYIVMCICQFQSPKFVSLPTPKNKFEDILLIVLNAQLRKLKLIFYFRFLFFSIMVFDSLLCIFLLIRQNIWRICE